MVREGLFRVTAFYVFAASPRWRHQMEAFSSLLALYAGNSPVTGEFPYKGQWRGTLMFSFFCAWTNDWVNNRDAGDLRRHCDVLVQGDIFIYQEKFWEKLWKSLILYGFRHTW